MVKTKQWLFWIGIASVPLGFLLLNCLILGKFELCIFRSLCGFPCPGCGMVHAAIALFLHGDLSESLRMHFFFIPISGTLFFHCFPDGVWHFADRVKRAKLWYYSLFICLIVYYIIRLIMYFPSDQYPMVYDPRNYLQIIWDLFTRK